MWGILSIILNYHDYVCCIDGFPGTYDSLSVQPFTDNTSYVVTNFDCNMYYECTNETNHSDDGCSMNGGYAVVTCAYG